MRARRREGPMRVDTWLTSELYEEAELLATLASLDRPATTVELGGILHPDFPRGERRSSRIRRVAVRTREKGLTDRSSHGVHVITERGRIGLALILARAPWMRAAFFDD